MKITIVQYNAKVMLKVKILAATKRLQNKEYIWIQE